MLYKNAIITSGVSLRLNVSTLKICNYWFTTVDSEQLKKKCFETSVLN